MKKIIILLFLAFQLLTFNTQAQITHYIWGQTVDNFTITDTDGNTHTLYDITAQGKYVYIDFFYTTCGPCTVFTPVFNEFYDKYGCNSGEVYCLAIDYYNTNSEVEAYEAAYGGSFHHTPVISGIDGGGNAVVDNFGVHAFPSVCVIDPDNKIFIVSVFPRKRVHDIENTTFVNGFNPSPQSCTTGLETELAGNLDFSIYPNPAKDYIMVNLKENERSAQLSIFNVAGKQIYATNVTSNQKVFIDLEQGIYFVKVITQNASGIEKLLIE